jgi:hypothetical protein
VLIIFLYRFATITNTHSEREECSFKATTIQLAATITGLNTVCYLDSPLLLGVGMLHTKYGTHGRVQLVILRESGMLTYYTFKIDVTH